jgi:hypothetical protein
MPIDKSMLDSMLGTFRGMAKDCEEKGASGEAFDKMKAAMDRMEQLGQEMDDFAAYSAKITTEGLQMTFSTYYGEVLGELNKPKQDGTGAYDDSALLNQTLNAYRDAINRLREGKEEAKKIATTEFDVNKIEKLVKDEMLIKPIEEVIKYGESGVNYPTFLREMIVKGLDKAMEGTAVLKDGLEYELGWAKATHVSPHDIEEKQEIFDKFMELVEKAKFNVPDSLDFELERKLIEHKYVPRHALWDAIKRRWEYLLNNLDTWVLAHMKKAPFIEPWSMAPDPKRAVQIDKDCIPGTFKIKEEIFKEYFNLSFHDIFKHETFLTEVNTFRLGFSQEYLEFLITEIYPACIPLTNLNKDLSKKGEQLYDEKRMSNPEWYRIGEKVQKHFDSVFGEGMYAKEFTVPVRDPSRQAKSWDLSTFKY